MKTTITMIVYLFFMYTIYAQKPSQQFKKDFDDELAVFTGNMTFLNSQLLLCYQDFHNAVNLKPLRIMKSERSYPSLLPMEAGVLMDFVGMVPNAFISNPVAAEINPAAGVLIGLLNEGWDAHNKEVENKRKVALIDETIKIYLNNQMKQDEYILRMDKFLRRSTTQPSLFEEKLAKIFYNSNKYLESEKMFESEKIYEELFSFNRRMENNPIFKDRDKAAAHTTKLFFYEDYINQFPVFKYNELLGTTGSLYGYLELTSGFKIKNKILVPAVPAGYEIGERFNSFLPMIHKKPLELKVVKVLWIKSIVYNLGHEPKIGMWQLTLDKDNYIRRRFLTKMIDNVPFLSPQPETDMRHAYEFLEKYGEYDKKKGLWKIPSSFFNEFTKKIPKEMSPPPSIRDMIEL